MRWGETVTRETRAQVIATLVRCLLRNAAATTRGPGGSTLERDAEEAIGLVVQLMGECREWCQAEARAVVLRAVARYDAGKAGAACGCGGIEDRCRVLGMPGARCETCGTNEVGEARFCAGLRTCETCENGG